jgi:RNA polymerase sigma-70 factor (ECF subfamily)
MEKVGEFDSRLRRARIQDSSARAKFLDAYRAYLCFLARDGIGVELQGKVAASDLAQDVMVAAQRDFPDFRGTSERELLAWLRRMLANRIVDYARKYGGARRRAGERSMEDILYESSIGFESVLAASGVSPSRHAEQREMATILTNALDRIDRDHQEVILLRNKSGLSWAEVAERMNRSPEAVRQLWVRALKSLKPRLKELL